MPRNAGTGVYTRVSNSFSQPIFGTLIDPTDADAYFDDLDVGLNPPSLAGPVAIVGAATATSLALNGATLGTDKLAVTGSATFSGALVVNNTIAGGTFTGTSTTANALAIGPAGATNPAFNVDASTGSMVAGLNVKGAVTGGTVAVAAIDSGSNTNLTINAKGTGTLAIGAVSTGAVSVAKVTITPPATSATLTLIDGTVLTGPAVTGTLVTKTSTDILTNKTLDSAGTGNVLKVSGVTVSAGQYPGETTTGSATAGNVGEYIETVVASGSAVSLVSATAKTIATLALTAGDWDVDVTLYFLFPASTSVTQMIASISGTTNVLDTTPGKFSGNSVAAFVPGAATSISSNIVPYRLSLSGSTNVFLVAQAAFTVSTLTAYGIIRARRAR